MGQMMKFSVGLFFLLFCCYPISATEITIPEEDEVITLVFFQPETTANPIEGNIACQKWVDLIGEHLGKKMIARFFISITEFDDYLDNHEVEIAILNPLYIIENYKKRKIEPRLVALRNGKSYSERVLVIRSESNIKQFEDLKGKLLITTNLGDRTIDFIEKIEFKAQVKFNDFFKELLFETNPRKCITALLAGAADVTMIPRANYEIILELEPSLQKSTRVLKTFQKIPLAAACYFADKISEAEAQKMMRATRAIQETPKGKQTMLIFKAEKWVSTSLEPYLELEKQLRQSERE
ncbi:phosphate/phosphite/phosphonate ABC transporter substrate-binding protein [candidate division CSSED10-310 bacterium]|uniref:Phosphate/phosphite/phosphonate ABC transporter substrate-binding protein n=1 Tax=candidate division CSSED10-310 bacterium TaxID=2855610 RepID=A0ABV6Z436_UNCC1